MLHVPAQAHFHLSSPKSDLAAPFGTRQEWDWVGEPPTGLQGVIRPQRQTLGLARTSARLRCRAVKPIH